MKQWVATLALCASWSAACFGGELLIYTENSYSIQGQTLDKNGELVGSAVDIVREIQRRVGNHSAISVVPWARGYLEVSQATTQEVVLFSVAKTADREPLFKWVGPIRRADYSFYAGKNSALNIHSLDDAKKVQAIGTFRDDVREHYLKEQGFTNLDSVTDNTQNVKKLLSGRINLMVASKSTLPELVAKAGFQPSDMKHMFTFLSADVYVAFSQSTSDAVVAAWGKALQDMKKDGTYARIHAKYVDPVTEK